MNITTRRYLPSDAQLFVELAARAFAHVPEHARPKDRPEFIAHTHGPANPAGHGFVVLAEEQGRVLGHVGGIPFRFVRRDGSLTTGWQIGCYVVDGTLQRKGIGKAILGELQATVAREEPSGFSYGYPNRRSLGPFLRLGGRIVARARTLLVPPTLSKRLRDEQGRVWTVRSVDAEDAATALGHMRLPAPGRPGFVRDAAYFRWRYLAPVAAPRYRFALAAPEGGGDLLLLALSEHRVRGVRFTILVDGLPELSGDRLGLALGAARIAGGGGPVYLTTNARWKRGPFAFALPERFDPRPVVDVLMSASDELSPDLHDAPMQTGDWMGF
ncbi:MAG: GNAT family N-acetyltransferase [Planctomycetes bacterium]|nr:GNAT family N-acetyltransferase [Planctomycetota bacterium]